MHFGLRNMDNILLKGGKKEKNGCCCFSLVLKTQWLLIPQECLVLSEMLLSCMPCIHNQLWLCLLLLTFLALSLQSQQDKFWLFRTVSLKCYSKEWPEEEVYFSTKHHCLCSPKSKPSCSLKKQTNKNKQSPSVSKWSRSLKINILLVVEWRTEFSR